jgi:hypothetical protein
MRFANSLARNGSVFGGIGRKCQDRCLAATCPRIGIECLAEVLRIAIQLPRKHKLPAFGCGKLGTVNAGAQQEAFRCCWRKRGRMRTFVSGIGSKIGIDVGQLLGKVRLSGWVAAHLEGAGRERKAARRLADPKIDTGRRQRRQQIESLGNLVGTVVLQHDPA